MRIQKRRRRTQEKRSAASSYTGTPRTGRSSGPGVLHTTPGGHDLDRKDIWPQIEAPLEELNQLARKYKIPLLVGGDFYIPAEGVVKNPSRNESEKMKNADKAGLWKVKAWSLARNAFLKAVETERLGELLENIKANQGASQGAPGGMEIEEAEATSKRMDIEEAKEAPESMEMTEGRSTVRGMEIEGKKGKKKTKYQPSAGIITRDNAKEISEQWSEYKNLIIGYFNKGEFSEQFKNETAIDLLAPGMGFDDVTWKKTLAYGEITELTILRNYRRIMEGTDAADEKFEGPAITMELALGNLGYKVVIAANPTNPKEKGAGENKMQLADLFLVNEYWPMTMGGILTPVDDKLKQVDSPGLDATKDLTNISDHAPVALIASTVPNDPVVHSAFKMPKDAEDQVIALNQSAWDTIAERLAGLNTSNNVPVKKQITAIKIALFEPLLSSSEEARVRGLVTTLRESIEGGHNDDLPAGQQQAVDEALRYLRQWKRPYYTTDVSNSPEK